MNIFQIVMIGILATIFIVLLKNYNPEYRIFLSLITGTIILLVVFQYMKPVLEGFRVMSNNIDIDNTYFEIIFKIIAVAYITEFGAQICKDAQENAIAMKIELAGKVIIIYFAMPIVFALMDFIINILP